MYRILCEDVAVGTVETNREGLYYQFACRCIPPDKQVYRICVSDGIIQQNLGICVPVGEHFVLNTRIPAKLLQGEDLTFYLIPAKIDKCRIPVVTNEPFEALDKLEAARFVNENGQPEILID